MISKKYWEKLGDAFKNIIWLSTGEKTKVYDVPKIKPNS